MDELSTIINQILQKIQKPRLSFQEIDLLLKYRMLRMVEKKIQHSFDSSQNDTALDSV